MVLLKDPDVGNVTAGMGDDHLAYLARHLGGDTITRTTIRVMTRSLESGRTPVAKVDSSVLIAAVL